VKRTLAAWSRCADRRLKHLLGAGRRSPAIRALGPKAAWQASVKVVGATAMRRLNSTYRRKSYVTDVLSFSAPEPFRGHGYLGELVLCAPVLEKQAAALKHSSEHELDVLLAHGLLHLLGLDHERSRAEAKRMGALERRLLSGYGLISRGT
jgi:probable rRNA maturation factor